MYADKTGYQEPHTIYSRNIMTERRHLMPALILDPFCDGLLAVETLLFYFKSLFSVN
jgi:hypothetical protein